MEIVGRTDPWHPDIGRDAARAQLVLDVLAAAQPDLLNATRMGSMPLANFSFVTTLTNWTIEFSVPVSRDFGTRDFAVEEIGRNYTIGGAAFLLNASAVVRVNSTLHRHLEEEHTGVVRSLNTEDEVVSGAPAFLQSPLWLPNVVAQGSVAHPEHTLELHLHGDAWMPEVGTDDGTNGATSQLLQALRTTSSAAYGWNEEVVASMTASSVTQLSDTVVVLTLPRAANYSIVQPETIDITIPAASVRSNAAIQVSSTVAMPEWARWPAVAVHPIVIQPRAGAVHLASDLANETDLQTEQLHTIDLTLEADTWVTTVGQFGAEVNSAIIRGFTSANNEASGWNRVARETLAFLASTQEVVQRLDDTHVRITVPYISGYEIEMVDNISLTLPRESVLTNRTTAATS